MVDSVVLGNEEISNELHGMQSFARKQKEGYNDLEAGWSVNEQQSKESGRSIGQLGERKPPDPCPDGCS
jgi:hypothetical protein